ncbi:Reverse transcriptase domain-containing protein [Aphis craccivora]|uniref:Reverse transcriptase domain-containing protein n=1 Tax=Aphis craccivora TaxID=307492 RepID=A0A6G0XYV9_APHCR|nr:Reverse transcriptase domain-containing protein [Aphis craccivora]
MYIICTYNWQTGNIEFIDYFNRNRITFFRFFYNPTNFITNPCTPKIQILEPDYPKWFSSSQVYKHLNNVQNYIIKTNHKLIRKLTVVIKFSISFKKYFLYTYYMSQMIQLAHNYNLFIQQIINIRYFPKTNIYKTGVTLAEYPQRTFRIIEMHVFKYYWTHYSRISDGKNKIATCRDYSASII